MAQQQNGWKTTVIAILATALLTGIAGWTTLGMDTVRRDEFNEVRKDLKETREMVIKIGAKLGVAD